MSKEIFLDLNLYSITELFTMRRKDDASDMEPAIIIGEGKESWVLFDKNVSHRIAV